MFYVLAGLWFVTCIFKTFASPDLRKSILTLLITTAVLSTLMLVFGSLEGAGITLAIGILPCAVRLTTFHYSESSKL